MQPGTIQFSTTRMIWFMRNQSSLYQCTGLLVLDRNVGGLVFTKGLMWFVVTLTHSAFEPGTSSSVTFNDLLFAWRNCTVRSHLTAWQTEEFKLMVVMLMYSNSQFIPSIVHLPCIGPQLIREFPFITLNPGQGRSTGEAFVLHN